MKCARRCGKNALRILIDAIDESQHPGVRDANDLPIAASAILEDVDALVSGDADFAPPKMEHPEISTPKGFEDKYRRFSVDA
jgi:hypothetical protein